MRRAYRTLVRVTAAAAVLVTATACTTPDAVPAPVPRPSPTAPAAGASDPPATAALVVRSTVRQGRAGPAFEEGALPEIRLVSSDRAVLRPVVDHEGTARFLALTAGAYTVRAAQRPCAGNYDYLDPPTGRCQGRVHVEDDTRASAVFFGTGPCRVSR